MKFGQNHEILSDSVWIGMALYGLVEILKLHIGSGRLSVGSGRLSGGMGLKSDGWLGQMGGSLRLPQVLV